MLHARSPNLFSFQSEQLPHLRILETPAENAPTVVAGRPAAAAAAGREDGAVAAGLGALSDGVADASVLGVCTAHAARQPGICESNVAHAVEHATPINAGAVHNGVLHVTALVAILFRT